MNIFLYTFICYAITTVISIGVVALMLLINNIMSRSDLKAAKQKGEE